MLIDLTIYLITLEILLIRLVYLLSSTKFDAVNKLPIIAKKN